MEFFVGIGLFLAWLLVYLFVIDRFLRRAIGKRYGVTIKLEVTASTMAIGWTTVDRMGQPIKNPPHRFMTEWLGFFLFWIVNFAMAILLVGGIFWLMKR